MNLTQQFDNINSKVIDDLKTTIQKGSVVNIAAASFSIYAFEVLKKELSRIKELRFLYTQPTFNQEKVSKERREFYIPKLDRERMLYGSGFEIKLRNQLTQKAIAKECAEWIKAKAKFKSNISSGTINGFLNISSASENLVYFPFNEFTTTEIGSESGNNLCPLIIRMASPLSDSYLKSFEELWKDSSRFKDVTDQVLDNIENVYKENSPQFIYFITLYNIFKEFLDDLSEDHIANEATGFKSSVIWGKLFNFQKDAALGIINKLEQFNGCILADSVGLGKTFTALSVIKYYENRNKNVLVLCPKKLYENWNSYKSNYKNNPLIADRLRYDVLFHSDLSRVRGKSNGIDLEQINWGNYDLLVIDESHNFRNGGKIYGDDSANSPKENRYLQLMNKVIRDGVKTKVLMLSATPVNNRFNDLKNQLQLAYEGDSESFDKLLGTTSSIDDIFRQAQTVYNGWTKQPQEERTTKDLLGKLSFDFFKVLDSVTIARSRRHIEQYYDTKDIGQFPKRLPPISRSPKLTDINGAINYKAIYEAITSLNLAIYTPSDFLLPSRQDKYDLDSSKSHANLSISGREHGIRRLMSINLLKRLESSVNSFRLTLERISALISDTLDKIDEGTGNSSTVDDFSSAESDLDAEDTEVSAFIGTKKTKIDIADLDSITWQRYLEDDLRILQQLLSQLEPITPDHDAKLQQLISDIKEKFQNPINADNKKVLIFTAFSDTAVYLYDNLAQDIKTKTGLNVALVTGTIDARSTLKLKGKLDFNKVLTLFCPRAKERDKLYKDTQDEIDVLIATDCISEGQNLQDCDYLINYDIHWNPVRIIQRFGRIDRIGSVNDKIQLVNYWPDMVLDDYINLKARVEARMKVSVLTSTGDDNPLSAEEKGDLEYRKKQLKRLQEEVVDLEEMSEGISIMDLGLNEFRQDLLSFMHSNPDVEHIPFGLHGVVKATESLPPGVIFILKNRRNEVNIDKKNRLHPFYLIYLSSNGDVITNHLSPKDLLDAMRLLCRGKTSPDTEACHAFNQSTNDGASMKQYSELLSKAISSIISVKEETDLDAFLGGEQDSLFQGGYKGLEDFELITFLVIVGK